ncbi:hypothetical protein RND81_13G012800 [Saponaria officinalis]|uniref:DUF3615 domain-containing protein n=1 Tax=Saponaria officinalis TaxID=3572 RepID=A0AAW1GXH7_SAPOF
MNPWNLIAGRIQIPDLITLVIAQTPLIPLHRSDFVFVVFLSLHRTEAKEKAILIPQSYLDWYLDVVEREIERPDFVELDTWEQQIRRYGELALAHFKDTGCCTEDYEYMSHTGAWYSGFLHFNFSARLKVSESRLEPGPLRHFFAEMRSENDEVTYCCILEDSIPDSEESGNLVVHPPGFACSECLGTEDYVCCS